VLVVLGADEDSYKFHCDDLLYCAPYYSMLQNQHDVKHGNTCAYFYKIWHIVLRPNMLFMFNFCYYNTYHEYVSGNVSSKYICRQNNIS